MFCFDKIEYCIYLMDEDEYHKSIYTFEYQN